MPIEVVSVYGYGRFGRLWADILAADFRVKVFSKRGLHPDDVPAGIEICSEEELFDCDAMFFCVAISSFSEVLQRVKHLCREETIFFDTCSVKVYPAKWMQEHLPEKSKIIATHPMFGPDSYDVPGKEHVMVMCNISAPQGDMDFWKDYFTAKSMRTECMTADMHDKNAAYSQGITHYMGRLFHDMELSPTVMDTYSYQALLKIVTQTCNDSWQLFLDLQNYNPYTRQMRDDLKKSIQTIDAALDDSTQVNQ